jgi:integrase
MRTKNRMTKHVKKYLDLRRAFGVQLNIAGKQLHHFAAFVDRVAPGEPLTVELILRWAQASSTGKQTTAAERLRTVRPFARYLRTVEPLTEVPPPRLLGPAQQRCNPHIYTEDEIEALLKTSKTLKPVDGLRPQTVRTYLSLLACTGMRPSEPSQLTRDDVNLQSGILTLRKTKFSKSRIVVLHPTAVEALQAYAKFRDGRIPHPRSAAFFLRDDGRPFTHHRAIRAFGRLNDLLSWNDRQPKPRLYDLRHTFVCRRVLAWYKDGVDLHVAVPSLSTYLGHANITHTYWYVTAIPELMEIAGARFETFRGTQEVRP